MRKFNIIAMDVKTDGLPEPNINKLYFAIYNSGCGYGCYHEETESILLDKPNIYGLRYEYRKTGKNRWYLDFDASGHEEEIETYFEVADDIWEPTKESDDIWNKLEKCKKELTEWKQVAKILSEELTATREENSNICWEDVDESSYAQTLYRQLLEKTT